MRLRITMLKSLHTCYVSTRSGEPHLEPSSPSMRRFLVYMWHLALSYDVPVASTRVHVPLVITLVGVPVPLVSVHRRAVYDGVTRAVD